MIIVHSFEAGKADDAESAPLGERTLRPGEPIPPDGAWIDLLEPTADERKAAEGFAGVSLPTPEEMDEIEPSELLYAEDGVRYMTARVLALAKTNRPKIANVTFIRKGNVLITVRYDDPKPFQMFSRRAQRLGVSRKDPDAIFVGLVDMIVARASEILRATGDRVDTLSEAIFERASRKGRPLTDEYQSVLASLGQEGSRISKARESLDSIELMLRFAGPPGNRSEEDSEPQGHIGTMLRDIASLETQTEYLLGKVQFLLDTILGLVNLSQNDIIKILSVITVVFTPPTFFASMYGMNFKNMPEYDWAYGYQYGLVLMLVSAVVPYLVFRWKKWL
ncbi:MAG: magnesium transporter CorA family protein [Hyphomicrobiales bacterium]|nr:magnesium transporter CorA family protein [Hyphomicrobiales bacterium]MBV8768905.1 magnesium transporter CorA family protein [Hyphomicrobiales bacterium]MBV9054976.1 magnesium transporter CorA family protein [Hyphomicrobiales bacterium]MBV9588007.1 magnesium transporter CorA family protein [Hyphomicrobiales bacterium]MBV9977821.1 magnesium transporter CorA family protein [Hyphomicrobiales bacterium]